jgi:hypothetical protein
VGTSRRTRTAAKREARHHLSYRVDTSPTNKTMSESSKRDEWDRHNRDEAKERAAQQSAAGPTHRPVPVEPYVSLTEQPAARDTDLNLAVLVEEYERATAAERLAWLAQRNRVAEARGTEAWNAWRDAVERTQRAVRLLVNYGTAHSEPT